MTESFVSAPASTVSKAAASATVRVIGPAVSWLCAMGIIPERETRPSVGLIPTIPHVADGQIIEPSVSVPTAMAARLAAIAEPEPDDDPQGLRSRIYGLCVCPPRPDQPLDDLVERKFAHSLKFVLPRIMAPASRSCFTIKASCFGVGASSSARLPAVVCILSAVSILSFSNIGMPCSGPRILPALRSVSHRSAIANASGLSSIIELSFLSISPIRARYPSVIFLAVVSPETIAACSPATVASSRLTPGTLADVNFVPIRIAAPAVADVFKNPRRLIMSFSPRFQANYIRDLT